MTTRRRDFLKRVAGGFVAAMCPIPLPAPVPLPLPVETPPMGAFAKAIDEEMKKMAEDLKRDMEREFFTPMVWAGNRSGKSHTTATLGFKELLI